MCILLLTGNNSSIIYLWVKMYDNNDDYDELTTRGGVPNPASFILAAWTAREQNAKIHDHDKGHFDVWQEIHLNRTNFRVLVPAPTTCLSRYNI